MKTPFMLGLSLLLAAGASIGADGNAGDAKRFGTVAVKEEAKVVKATGTIEPEEMGEVGAQVTGTVSEVAVDYGSVVKKGMVVARLDSTLYKAEVRKAEAEQKRAEAKLKFAKSNADLAGRELERIKKRSGDARADDPDIEVAKAAYQKAKDQVSVEEAALEDARAELEMATVKLDYTTIRSPIDGIVIDRRITVGQTVGARLDTPSLFLVAKDLKKMEVWASVPEADIARVAVGQAVTYTVAAHPKASFRGTVKQMRLNATLNPKDGATYTVAISTDNPEGTLLPYMTARVSIEVGDK